ncbi:PREDICTED: histone-lysine N-methyltransferase SETMAR-like [Trachymyrmex septentrionalis]|uniref:histone-lysine N-methyltransferase SETMAR-like n=1 Tax=Trachymyrmex septentrionalis TaxID=34720 RepID=UPI00084F706F|nr:PREDICTED: histone-lysine N-methyltransferase SETMAR-like [Trachymyrmex septentrionalis]
MSFEGKNATQTRKKICAVYGENAVSDRMCQKWFAKFRSGEMNIEDAPRSGRPVTTDVDQITALIDSDRQITVREIAARLNIGKSVVSEHLNKLQIIKKLDVWVPHDLTEKNRIDRISISDLLYKRNEYDPFLKRIIIGDEKWIIYNNVERKRSWSKRGEPPSTTPKAGLHPKKTAVKTYLDQFFASKPQTFYESGIMKLLERWQEVINKNGEYIID